MKKIWLFLLFLSVTLFCQAQDDISLSPTPESLPGAMDGKLEVRVLHVGNGAGQYPPPFTFMLEDVASGDDPMRIENNSGTAVFTGLGYRYYCLTVVMGNGCSAHSCFYFDEACASGCLVGDFNYEYDSDACTVLFEDWSEGNVTSWAWQFGDGSSASTPNPAHTYSESKCYNVSLTVTNGTQTRTITKQVCINGCPDGNILYPDCHITGPTAAAKGQTINLGGVSSGVGPFDYHWTTPAFINPMPSSEQANISVTIPTTANNGTIYNFSLVTTDSRGNTTVCEHQITVGGNMPDVEVAAFGTFEPNKPLVLVAFVDYFNLTGPEHYYFTIKQGTNTVQIPGSCVNTWLNGDYDCTLASGLPEGFYTVCVDVRDAAGTYSDCLPLVIGSPVVVPPSPPMWMEIKYPANPEVNPATGHYVLRQGEFLKVGVAGSHPGAGSCSPDEYFVILHVKHLTNNTLSHIGETFSTNPPYCQGTPPTNYTLTEGQDWGHPFVPNCNKGTISVTATVFQVVDCGDAGRFECFNDPGFCNSSNPFFCPVYEIETPILIDIFLGPPQISEISVEYSQCSQPIHAGVVSSCSIQSHEWHAYDPHSNEEIIGCFSGNTNTATVTPNLNHAFFQKFESGDIAKIRCKVTVVDINGFTAEHIALLSIRVPLRINLPLNMYRCPGEVTRFAQGPVASGGEYGYSFTWNPSTLSGENPEFTAPTQGTAIYSVTVTDANNCTASGSTTVSASPLNLAAIMASQGLACSGQGQASIITVGPYDLSLLGGSGQYGFEWQAANPADLDYLSDVFAPNPTVLGVPAGQTITYTLLVGDLLSQCTATASVQILGVANDLSLSLSGPASVCYGTPVTLQAQGLPAPTGWASLAYYYAWSTDNRNHPGIADEYSNTLPIGALVSSYPGTYKYTVRYVNRFSGCYTEREMNVTVRENWTHVGYVPKVKSAVMGTSVPLWENNSNSISGISPNLGITWSPFNATDIIYFEGAYSALPKNGKFIPTTTVPSLTMRVLDISTGCAKNYKSQRYIISDQQPELWISGKNPVICDGQNTKFDIAFDAHLPNYSTSLLPSSVEVKIKIYDPWGPPFPPPVEQGMVSLSLVNAAGLYKGEYTTKGLNRPSHSNYFCEAILNSAIWTGISSSIYEIVISSGGNSSSTSICTLDGGLVATKINYGIGCSAGVHQIRAPKKFVARDYIEIHTPTPGASIELTTNDQQGFKKGPHLLIDPCITGPESPTPLQNDSIPTVLTETRTATDSTHQPQTRSDIALEVFPNPFTGQVTIRYTVPPDCPGDVALYLRDFTGRQVKTLERRTDAAPGTYQATFDGTGLPSGIYLYELVVCNGTQVVKKAEKISH